MDDGPDLHGRRCGRRGSAVVCHGQRNGIGTRRRECERWRSRRRRAVGTETPRPGDDEPIAVAAAICEGAGQIETREVERCSRRDVCGRRRNGDIGAVRIRQPVGGGSGLPDGTPIITPSSRTSGFRYGKVQSDLILSVHSAKILVSLEKTSHETDESFVSTVRQISADRRRFHDADLARQRLSTIRLEASLDLQDVVPALAVLGSLDERGRFRRVAGAQVLVVPLDFLSCPVRHVAQMICFRRPA
jgi:hypothetical protein